MVIYGKYLFNIITFGHKVTYRDNYHRQSKSPSEVDTAYLLLFFNEEEY